MKIYSTRKENKYINSYNTVKQKKERKIKKISRDFGRSQEQNMVIKQKPISKVKLQTDQIKIKLSNYNIA